VNTVVCICTYRRPDGLRELLYSLRELDGITNGMHVIVVDNDAAGEGAAVCDALPNDFPLNVHASVEPQAGISPARNAAVRNALAFKSEFIAFLDDDEQPSQQWLSELHRIQQQTNADVIGGPTLSVFPDNISDDIKQNPYYGADLGMTDAQPCQLQAAGNFMIRSSVIESMAPEFFHPAFAHSGGEDLAFFTQLAANGATMAWAANAIVHEDVPASRLSESWLKQRVINIANSRVRVMQMLQPGATKALVRGLKTCALFAWAAANTIAALVMPERRESARLLRWKFIGKLTAHLRIATTRGEGH